LKMMKNIKVSNFEAAKAAYIAEMINLGKAFNPLAIGFTVEPQPAGLSFTDADDEPRSDAMTLLELACYWGLNAEVVKLIDGLTQAEEVYYQQELGRLTTWAGQSVSPDSAALVASIQIIGQRTPATPPLQPTVCGKDEMGVLSIETTPPKPRGSTSQSLVTNAGQTSFQTAPNAIFWSLPVLPGDDSTQVQLAKRQKFGDDDGDGLLPLQEQGTTDRGVTAGYLPQ
jgi:hypothetical protein